MLLAQSYISGYTMGEGEREQRKGRGRRGRKQTSLQMEKCSNVRNRKKGCTG